MTHNHLTDRIQRSAGTSSSDSKILGACCRRLAEIADDDDDAKDTMRAAGVIQCVIDAMKVRCKHIQS